MDPRNRRVAVGALNHGDHSLFSYAADAEHDDAVRTLAKQAVANNERLLYVGEPVREQRTRESVTAMLATRLAPGQFLTENPADTYLRGGFFDAGRMIGHYAEVATRAVADGFRGVRVLADMTWARGMDDIATLASYERALDAICGAAPVVIVCQYDRRTFGEDAMAALEAAHAVSAHVDPLYASSYMLIERAYDPSGLQISGELDIANRELFRDALADAGRRANSRGILLDLTRIRYMDAASIGAVLRMSIDRSVRLRLNRQIERLFQITCPELPRALTMEVV